MKTYTAHIAPKDSADTSDFKLLRDGLSLIALALPLFWLIFHRLWWALLIYSLVFAGLGVLAATDFRVTAIILSFLPALFLFLEGDNLVRQKWERKGWQQVDTVCAANLEEAEARFLGSHHNFGLEMSLASKPTTLSETAKVTLMPPVGLFPMDGKA